MVKKPVTGFRSSLVASTLALLMLMVILFASNSIQKAREGEGKYSFDDELCYDINSEKDFDNTWQIGAATGTGAMLYAYWELAVADVNNEKVTTQSTSINGTVGNYAVSKTTPNPGDTPTPSPGKKYTVGFLLNFTKKKIIDLDIVRIDIYLNIAGVSFSKMNFRLTDESASSTVFSGEDVSIGNLTSIKVEVNDLLQINTFNTNDKIQIGFDTELGEFIPGNTFVVFDMQFYSIKEVKIPSLTALGLWMGAGGLFYIFLGLVVSPEYTIEGIINSMVSLSKGGK